MREGVYVGTCAPVCTSESGKMSKTNKNMIKMEKQSKVRDSWKCCINPCNSAFGYFFFSKLQKSCFSQFCYTQKLKVLPEYFRLLRVTKLVLINIKIKTNRGDYFIIQKWKVDVPEWNPFVNLVRVDLDNCAYLWKICSYACWQEDEVPLNYIWILTVWWFTIWLQQEFK